MKLIKDCWVLVSYGRVWPRESVTFPQWLFCAHSSCGSGRALPSPRTSGCLTPLPPSMWPQRGRAPAQQVLVHSLCTSETPEELARPCGASQTSIHPWCCEAKQMAGLWHTTLSNLPGGSRKTCGGQCKLCCISQPQAQGNDPRLHS